MFGEKHVSAGAIKGTVQGFTGTEWWVNTSSFVTYCVEFTETYVAGGPYDYTLVNGADYAFGSNNPATTVDSFAISLRLGKLFTYLDGLGDKVDSSLESAAVQLAVWEIIYEKPTGVSLDLRPDDDPFSNFFVTSTNREALINQANAYLDGSTNTLNTYGVYVLTRGGNQDWLALQREGGGPNSVPEPTSLALAFGALGLLGAASRRRKPASV
jgi:hypothetical protein